MSLTTPGPEFAEAIRDSKLLPLCERCRANHGLCRRCLARIGPHLSKPMIWLLLMGRMHHKLEMTAEERVVRERYEAKASRREQALLRAIGGKFTKVKRRKVA